MRDGKLLHRTGNPDITQASLLFQATRRSGGYQVVDASSHSTRANGLNEFMFRSGPARRFIGVLTPDRPIGEEVIPGGRSGVFLSPHYADQLPLWLTNAFHALTLGADDADMTEVSRIQFVPASSD